MQVYLNVVCCTPLFGFSVTFGHKITSSSLNDYLLQVISLGIVVLMFKDGSSPSVAFRDQYLAVLIILG